VIFPSVSCSRLSQLQSNFCMYIMPMHSILYQKCLLRNLAFKTQDSSVLSKHFLITCDITCIRTVFLDFNVQQIKNIRIHPVVWQCSVQRHQITGHQVKLVYLEQLFGFCFFLLWDDYGSTTVTRKRWLWLQNCEQPPNNDEIITTDNLNMGYKF